MFIRGLGIGVQYQQVLDATVGPPSPPVEDNNAIITDEGERIVTDEGEVIIWD